MKEQIKINDFSKLNLRLGKVIKNDKKGIAIKCNLESFNSNLLVDANVGDLIVISSAEGKLIVPVINGDIPLIPEKNAENGWKIS